MERLKRSLVRWMTRICTGPVRRRVLRREREDRAHPRPVGLPQRYMFTAMTLIRLAFDEIAESALGAEVIPVRAGGEQGARSRARHHARDVPRRLRGPRRSAPSAWSARRSAARSRARSTGTRAPVSWPASSWWASTRTRSCALQPGSASASRGSAATRTSSGRCSPRRSSPRRSARITARSWRTSRRGRQRQRRSRWRASSARAPARSARCAGSSRTRPRSCDDEVVLFAIGQDTTDENALAPRVRQSEKLAAVGDPRRPALAHEIRNPLNGAQLHVTFLERGLARAG